MKVVTAIFARIWALWGILWFIATMLIFLPYFILLRFLVSEPNRTRLFISASRVWMGIYMPLIGCPFRVRGKENFKKGQNYIVVCNHNSFLDVPITSPGIPGTNKTIAKKEFASIPLFGIIYQLGSVLVDRKSEQSRRESYSKMKQVLDMGMHMCIYPEGTRNKSNEPLKPFQDGAFKLAMETGKPIMPAILFNTRKALPADQPFFLLPKKLEMHFLPPFEVQPGETVKEIKEKVFEAMQSFIQKH